jgi:cytochrome oxidase Cu insertion factor (SCO1/SenC/PrrC family)
MQYFLALKLGQKRVAAAREYLNTLTNGKAMPALALTDTKSSVWQAVGEENLYAFVDESAGFILTDNSGYILALVDKSGSSKTIVQGVTQLQKENLEKIFEKDNIPKFEGKVILPV